MLESIENIRTIARLCHSNEPLPDALSAWLAASLQQFLDQRCQSMNDAFGIRNGRGGVPWWMEARIRVRDTALRRLGCDFFADHSISARTTRIRQLTLRYAASAWRHDRNHPAMPQHYHGTPHELIWQAFKSGAMMPLAERQLRKILGP
ncbi:MAG: hypothetical protein AB7G15_18270 [Alphaproteobacteria bacterium]